MSKTARNNNEDIYITYVINDAIITAVKGFEWLNKLSWADKLKALQHIRNHIERNIAKLIRNRPEKEQ